MFVQLESESQSHHDSLSQVQNFQEIACTNNASTAKWSDLGHHYSAGHVSKLQHRVYINKERNYTFLRLAYVSVHKNNDPNKTLTVIGNGLWLSVSKTRDGKATLICHWRVADRWRNKSRHSLFCPSSTFILTDMMSVKRFFLLLCMKRKQAVKSVNDINIYASYLNMHYCVIESWSLINAAVCARNAVLSLKPFWSNEWIANTSQ